MNRYVAWLIFVTAFLLAISWAATTKHVWEDYYITFRSSKNLATGNGLVFNVGDKLHTFTSPLGVLLPAAASSLSGNKSDELALWIFRVWSGLAFAGAVTLIYILSRAWGYGRWATLAVVGFVAIDAKSLDFTTNGMETGFLLLFVAYALWAMFASGSRKWLHLGLAWAGLMWTRPDSFLYVGLLSAGAFFFNDPKRTGLTRANLLGLFFRAGLVCTVLYLPWLLWSWNYYGTPIPNTITAKGGVSGSGKSALGLIKTILNFPWTVWSQSTSLESTFLPSYFQIGGWPNFAIKTAQALALVLSFQWVLPLWRMEVRVASFAFCGLHAYLSYFPYFPFPWYLPGTTLLAAITFGGMIAQLFSLTDRRAEVDVVSGWSRGFRVLLFVTVIVSLGAESWVSRQMNREMTLEQIYSANGVRRRTGEWLKENSRPGDTVFMEPLGNIGYFSGLKTYDFPGLSSREMVEAIRTVGVDWATLVEYLSPDWLVLRPQELSRMKNSIHRLFGDGYTYKMVKEFNNLPQIAELDVYGRPYIEFDSRLLVFQRQTPRRYKLDPTGSISFEGLHLPVVYIDQRRMYTVHATGMISIKVPKASQKAVLAYGLPEATYQSKDLTDGVEFSVTWTDGSKSEKLLLRYLDPVSRPRDRGAQVVEVDIPQSAKEGTLIMVARCGPSDAMDWSCWAVPEFK